MQRARLAFVRRSHRALSGRPARERGAAMVEAVIVIPVFILLLTGATYVRALHAARAETRLAARGCAWEHALTGCEGGSACGGLASNERADGLPDLAQSARAQSGGGVDPFSDIPLLGDAFQTICGTSTRATIAARVPFPFDDALTGDATSENVVLCNAVPRTVLELARDLLLGFFE